MHPASYQRRYFTYCFLISCEYLLLDQATICKGVMSNQSSTNGIWS